MPPVCFDPEATSERGIPRGFFYATGSERRPNDQEPVQVEEDYVMVRRESVLDLAWDRVGYVGDQGQQKQDGDLLSHQKLLPRETLAGEAWGGFSIARSRVCADHRRR
jgi:hypothetical protein